ncbi:MAG: ATP-grasp domain-containing protein [Clostridia bacterium]|nr:ATP-grasp domain-containing protein [Clostridia bacterium]
MKNVAIFFGGISVEHDVSVLTGIIVSRTLKNSKKYNPVPVFIDTDGRWYTGEALFNIDFYKNIDRKKLTGVIFLKRDRTLYRFKKNKLKPFIALSCAINCMHGENGEDGTLSGIAKAYDIPLCSPDIFSSALSMDKELQKKFLKGIGVKVTPCIVFRDNLDEIEKKFSYPVIIKPANLGSSIGIKKADNRRELEEAVLLAKKYSDKIIAEKYLSGFTEINCAAYQNSAGDIVVSQLEKPKSKDGVLSFSDKYCKGDREFPAKTDEKTANKIRKITAKVYKETGANGIVRIDYMIYNGEIILNEINSVPGSLSYYLFCPTFTEFTAILEDVIEKTERENNGKSTLLKVYKSSILEGVGTKASKRL